MNDSSDILSFSEGAELIINATRSTLDDVGDSWDRFYILFDNVTRYNRSGGHTVTKEDAHFSALISHDFILSYIMARKELGITDDIMLFKEQFFKIYQTMLRADTAKGTHTTH